MHFQSGTQSLSPSAVNRSKAFSLGIGSEKDPERITLVDFESAEAGWSFIV
jgi:hypothetical protein